MGPENSDVQTGQPAERSFGDAPPAPLREPLPLPDPQPIPWPDPWPPPWIRCLRTQPVSGRYEGAGVRPGPIPIVRSILDLRVDIDSAYSNSPVMNRVSADFYRVLPSIWPTPPARVYQESWIIDAPNVVWQRCQVQITGTVRWWHGAHPATSAQILIPWTWTTMGPATVTLMEAGGSTRTYTCAKRSQFFRDLELEVDVCESVDAPPLLPSYDTHAHNTRPAGLPQRTLTVAEAYREAGVELTLSPTHTVIDDSAPGFASWSPAELHDAMEVNYSRFPGVWPAWRMWGLLAGLFDNAGVGGIMFDAAAGFGGAGEAPERQGFAVFRGHSWFNNLPAGTPSTQDEAWAMRHYLYTYVHEAGHAFNLLHSWDKNRPDALSWMNYDWRYDTRNGANSFWSNFRFRFDDEELIHVRHGDRPSVVMGGDPWASGGHLEGPPAGAMAQLEGQAPLELLVRSKRYFEFMEPVFLELRVRNLTAVHVEVDTRLQPEFGTVALFVQRPDGTIVAYSPVMCQLGLPELRTLSPTGVDDGSDRYSVSVFLSYGSRGFVFDVPGQYLVRAIYQGTGDVVVPSNTLQVRVGTPVDREQDMLAQDYFTHDVGLSLYLGGSQSPFLASGMATLERVADTHEGTVLGARAAETIAASVARPFFRLEEVDGRQQLVEAHSPEPDRALERTAAALAVYRKTDDPTLNLSYHRLVRARAEALQATGSPEAAKDELAQLREELESRGVNKVVLDDIDDAADELGKSGA
jgi:hypothetical protein